MVDVSNPVHRGFFLRLTALQRSTKQTKRRTKRQCYQPGATCTTNGRKTSPNAVLIEQEIDLISIAEVSIEIW